MKSSSKVGFSGHFKIEKRSVDSEGNTIPGSEKTIDWFPNLITNTGMDLLGGSGFMRRCSLGTSNSPPSFTDTALGTRVGFVDIASVATAPGGEDHMAARGTYEFSQGQIVGNIQEIGIGTVSDSLFSRALILDSNGDPTVLTLTEIDILTVTYDLRCYPSQNDVVDNISDGANTYTVTTRTAAGARAASMRDWANGGGPIGANVNVWGRTYNGPIGAWTSTPSGASGTASQGNTATNHPYAPGTHKKSVTFNFAIGQGNADGGIRSMMLDPGTSTNQPFARLQSEFDPPIPKDNTKTLSVTWELSWGRVP